MTTKPDYIRQSLHADDLDDDGHDIYGNAPVVMYVESNAPPTGPAFFDFDTFRDVAYADLSLVIPAAMGLTYSGLQFVASQDGVWSINFDVEIAAAPGENGSIYPSIPTWASNPVYIVTAAGAATRWTGHLILPMQTGSSFGLYNDMPTVAGATYAAIDIVRVARSVS